MWLDAAHGKGMEIKGVVVRRGGALFADMTFGNRALAPMSDFAIQFNKNRFVRQGEGQVGGVREKGQEV